MSQSIWGSTHRTASTTIRIPVDTSSSSSPGYVTGSDIVDLTLSSQSSNSGKVLKTNGTAASWTNIIECIGLSPSDETTDLSIGIAKLTCRVPYSFTITGIKASLTDPSAGAAVIADINVNGTSILSTKLSIDATEKTSVTATSAVVISSTALVDDDEITIDIDQVGSSTPGKGLKIYILGYRNI